MVNYCCVLGCNNNSRTQSYLVYHALPKENSRLIKWLKAVQREDLIRSIGHKTMLSRRVCSQHFQPSSIKNKHLAANAVPSLNIGASATEAASSHAEIACDACARPVRGVRYKCVTCLDYDLCARCEAARAHPDHYMIRMPRPLSYTTTENITNTLREISNELQRAEHGDSSDDEPITKYRKYEDQVSLPESVKETIRAEVARSLAQPRASETTIVPTKHRAGRHDPDILEECVRKLCDDMDGEFGAGTSAVKVEMTEAAIDAPRPDTYITEDLCEFLIKKT